MIWDRRRVVGSDRGLVGSGLGATGACRELDHVHTIGSGHLHLRMISTSVIKSVS